MREKNCNDFFLSFFFFLHFIPVTNNNKWWHEKRKKKKKGQLFDLFLSLSLCFAFNLFFAFQLCCFRLPFYLPHHFSFCASPVYHAHCLSSSFPVFPPSSAPWFFPPFSFFHFFFFGLIYFYSSAGGFFFVFHKKANLYCSTRMYWNYSLFFSWVRFLLLFHIISHDMTPKESLGKGQFLIQNYYRKKRIEVWYGWIRRCSNNKILW